MPENTAILNPERLLITKNTLLDLGVSEKENELHVNIFIAVSENMEDNVCEAKQLSISTSKWNSSSMKKIFRISTIHYENFRDLNTDLNQY